MSGSEMRSDLDLSETKADDNSSFAPTPSSASKDEVEWLPLQNHPLFAAGAGQSSTFRWLPNLLAWDGGSRLYFWDSKKHCLHRLSIRLGEPEPTSVLAASPSKVLQLDGPLTFMVDKISINRNGSAILLSGLDGLLVMYLYGQTSKKNASSMCRTVSIGSGIYFNSNCTARTLQISWHPYSETHVGILSSDSVFRLFDFSLDLGQPEQEYYLQPLKPGRRKNAASICPADFSFGGDHLWDRFSVFVLFSDGSIYVLCPVVPFGSVYKYESILEIYSDAQTFGLRSANPNAVSNSNRAISWLEATFPELTNQAMGGNFSAVKAQPYALFDASISLQGPLPKVYHGVEEDSRVDEGHAVNLLYNPVSKDSILVTAWSDGQLHIDALVDEIQPVWVVRSQPHLHVNSYDRVLGVAMICESVANDQLIEKLDNAPDQTVWSGHPPPLLRLAMVDLALPCSGQNSSLISMLVDPLMPERIYTVHNRGVDSIVLHAFPFTTQTIGKDESIRTPSVHPVLFTCQGESSSASPLLGFVVLSDSFGYSWIVGLTSSFQCIVLEMKIWDLLLPIHVDKENKPTNLEKSTDIDAPTIINKELLNGPEVVRLPSTSPGLCSVTADSIEGQSTLQQYYKLFHENYVDYVHKVCFELEHHGPQVKIIIEDQHNRLHEVQQKLLKFEEKQGKIEDCIRRATEQHSSLEERLQRLRNLLGVQRKPLPKVEWDFKSELGPSKRPSHPKERNISVPEGRIEGTTAPLHEERSKPSHEVQGVSLHPTIIPEAPSEIAFETFPVIAPEPHLSIATWPFVAPSVLPREEPSRPKITSTEAPPVGNVPVGLSELLVYLQRGIKQIVEADGAKSIIHIREKLERLTTGNVRPMISKFLKLLCQYAHNIELELLNDDGLVKLAKLRENVGEKLARVRSNYEASRQRSTQLRDSCSQIEENLHYVRNRILFLEQELANLKQEEAAYVKSLKELDQRHQAISLERAAHESEVSIVAQEAETIEADYATCQGYIDVLMQNFSDALDKLISLV